MFTGLIQEVGTVEIIKKSNASIILTVKADKVLNEVRIGDSIAINGACQTVIELNDSTFSVFVSAETLSVTTFSKFKVGSVVNLERTLRLSDRLDGHMVSGHVDGIAKLCAKNKVGDAYEFIFEAENRLCKQIVKKGSVTIDGISLTVADITDKLFKIAVIPHTYENTNLCTLTIGDNVNIETDIIAKYVEKYLSSNDNRSNIDMNFLERNGFL